MITIYMLKTPHCIKCEMLKPTWDEIKANTKNVFNDSVDFKEIVAGQDKEALIFIEKYKIKSAPSFIYCNDNEECLIELNEIVDKIKSELGDK